MGTLVNERMAARRPVVLIWIDAEAATLVRWTGTAHVERIASDVPSRHVSTGHVRHDPMVRHGGGGAAQDQLARERLGHVRRYLDQVVAAIGCHAKRTANAFQRIGREGNGGAGRLPPLQDGIGI